MGLFILILLGISLTGVESSYDWGQVESVIAEYQGAGAFAGGILRVSNGSDTIFNLPFGHLSHSEIPFGSPVFTNSTIFDMASVTKVSATLSCIMHLYE